MRKIRTITVTEVDRDGEIIALAEEAARRAKEIGTQTVPFKPGDVVRMTTGRRSPAKGALVVIFTDPDANGEYRGVYLTDNGDFAETNFRFDQADHFDPNED